MMLGIWIFGYLMLWGFGGNAPNEKFFLGAFGELAMARYEHLPIYKAAFDLNLYFEQIVRHFSRYHKYSLGAELRSRAREVVRLIVRANNTPDDQPQAKYATLQQLREELEQLKLTIRLCKEVKAFHNFKSFQTAINQVITLSKQNEGWLKSLSLAEPQAEPAEEAATDGRSRPQTDRA
jgi:hypothetical protein